MGYHFVPQRYLRGFETSEKVGWIWMFDKLTAEWKFLPIKQVAQRPAFYDDNVEVELNKQVEIPGNDVIDKILRGERISETDRMHLSYYVGTMIRRVPYARKKAEEMIPKVLKQVAHDTKEKFVEWARHGYIDDERLRAELDEVARVEKKFQGTPPEEVRKRIETPWPFQSMLIAIHSMYWRVLRSEGPSLFLTSDNPASFFEGFGLGHEECELILPLSSTRLLHCSWQRCDELTLDILPQKLVKEMNRRTACSADRFVFYHKQARWVLSASQNRQEQLNRIRWQ